MKIFTQASCSSRKAQFFSCRKVVSGRDSSWNEVRSSSVWKTERWGQH